MLTISTILDCQFVFDPIKSLIVFWCALRFITIQKNGSKETLLSFVQKIKLNVQGLMKCEQYVVSLL